MPPADQSRYSKAAVPPRPPATQYRGHYARNFFLRLLCSWLSSCLSCISQHALHGGVLGWVDISISSYELYVIVCVPGRDGFSLPIRRFLVVQRSRGYSVAHNRRAK